MGRKQFSLWLRLAVSLSACIICLGAFILLDFMTDAMNDTNKIKVIAELVSMRTDAMNGYFAGETELMHAEEQLHDAEAGDLLEEDLINLKAFQRTDIELIESYEITEVVLLSQTSENLSARVTVDWTVSGIDGLNKFAVTYDVVCEKHGETLKLVEFF